jgi:hypothetical protein
VKSRRWLLAAAVFPLVLAACTSTAGRPGPGTGTAGTSAGSGSAAPGGLRAVRHVWVIELENQGYAQSFGTPSADPYLARTLPRMGALLENYYAIGHSSVANYVAQVSGQAPDLGTQSDCPAWFPFAGHIVAGPYHQVLGEGCVYPAAVQTLGNQLSTAGRSWAAYLQDMGNDPARDNTVSTAVSTAAAPRGRALPAASRCAGRSRQGRVQDEPGDTEQGGMDGPGADRGATQDGGQREQRQASRPSAPSRENAVRPPTAVSVSNPAVVGMRNWTAAPAASPPGKPLVTALPASPAVTTGNQSFVRSASRCKAKLQVNEASSAATRPGSALTAAARPLTPR